MSRQPGAEKSPLSPYAVKQTMLLVSKRSDFLPLEQGQRHEHSMAAFRRCLAVARRKRRNSVTNPDFLPVGGQTMPALEAQFGNHRDVPQVYGDDWRRAQEQVRRFLSKLAAAVSEAQRERNELIRSSLTSQDT